MWWKLQIFGFRALWSPYFILFVIGLALAYFLITGPYRHKFGDNKKPSATQQSYFYIGMLLLYITKGSPIDLLSHIMLTAHMIQMVILFLIFPIMVIKGVPLWVWEKIGSTLKIGIIFKWLTKPLIALLLFNVLFSLYHMPAIFDFSKSSQMAHSSITIILLFTAFLMWWPIINPNKEVPGLAPLLKMGYLVASAAIITIACALIIFAPDPLFLAYSSEGAWVQAMSLCVPGDVLEGIAFTISGPEMFSPLTIRQDQQLGGIVMKIMQEIIYGVLLARIFFSWFSRKSLEVDPLPTTNITESY